MVLHTINKNIQADFDKYLWYPIKSTILTLLHEVCDSHKDYRGRLCY